MDCACTEHIRIRGTGYGCRPQGHVDGSVEYGGSGVTGECRAVATGCTRVGSVHQGVVDGLSTSRYRVNYSVDYPQ